jgi:hypothetical protein
MTLVSRRGHTAQYSTAQNNLVAPRRAIEDGWVNAGLVAMSDVLH